ncbi:MAG TPA: metalloregulator ArsR/SmtB family transcription factor [Gaiellaceae bacterium]|jgi:ArsR family transcriptional regulator, arsenate/arsenite/antimonite-responsive transcriptional repressor|nr:metalloregulator ArsR/SmtB family transcription factor [Gaiellaceae bacterium]
MKKLPVITPICCAPAIAPVSPEIAERLASQFKALADPTRVGIVNRLAAASEVCVCDLTSVFGLSQPTVSHHLRVLREAGLVDATKRGTWSYYRLVPDAIEPLRLALGG